jgi:hypothetical protein
MTHVCLILFPITGYVPLICHVNIYKNGPSWHQCLCDWSVKVRTFTDQWRRHWCYDGPFLGMFAQQMVTISLVLSVHMEQLGNYHTGYLDICYLDFLLQLSGIFSQVTIRHKIINTLHEDLRTWVLWLWRLSVFLWLLCLCKYMGSSLINALNPKITYTFKYLVHLLVLLSELCSNAWTWITSTWEVFVLKMFSHVLNITCVTSRFSVKMF